MVEPVGGPMFGARNEEMGTPISGVKGVCHSKKSLFL